MNFSQTNANWADHLATRWIAIGADPRSNRSGSSDTNPELHEEGYAEQNPPPVPDWRLCRYNVPECVSRSPNGEILFGTYDEDDPRSALQQQQEITQSVVNALFSLQADLLSGRPTTTREPQYFSLILLKRDPPPSDDRSVSPTDDERSIGSSDDHQSVSSDDSDRTILPPTDLHHSAWPLDFDRDSWIHGEMLTSRQLTMTFNSADGSWRSRGDPERGEYGTMRHSATAPYCMGGNRLHAMVEIFSTADDRQGTLDPTQPATWTVDKTQMDSLYDMYTLGGNELALVIPQEQAYPGKTHELTIGITQGRVTQSQGVNTDERMTIPFLVGSSSNDSSNGLRLPIRHKAKITFGTYAYLLQGVQDSRRQQRPE